MLKSDNKSSYLLRLPIKKISLSPAWCLALLILAALIIRIWAVTTRDVIQYDEATYMRMAQNISDGLGPLGIIEGELARVIFFPLLPILIAGVNFLVKDWSISGYAVTVLMGSFLLVPAYLLGRLLYGSRAGLMAAALVAALPLMVDYSSRIYSETIYAFFLLLAVYFGYLMLNNFRLRYFLLTGALLGLAYLSNPASLFYVVIFTILTIAVWMKRREWKQGAALTVSFLAVFLFFAMPYIFFIHGETGKWTYSGKTGAGNIYTAKNNLRFGTAEWEKDTSTLDESGEIKEIGEQENAEPLGFIIRNPKTSIRIFAEQSYIFYSEELQKVIPLWLLPLLGLGLLSHFKNRERVILTGYLILMTVPILIILSLDHRSRFFVPFVPVFMVFVARGWEVLEKRLNEIAGLLYSGEPSDRSHKMTACLTAAVVILPVLLFSMITILSLDYEVNLKEAGRWIGLEEKGERVGVMARNSTPAYYGNGTWVILPHAALEETTDYAASHDVEYMVLRKDEIGEYRPFLSELVEGESGQDDWELVHTVWTSGERETLIFRLLK